MRSLLVHAVAKLVLACIIIMFLSIFLSGFYPTLTNQVAMGQLENDDFAFATWEMWQNVYTIVHAVMVFVGGITGVSIAADVYKYFKLRKEI